MLKSATHYVQRILLDLVKGASGALYNGHQGPTMPMVPEAALAFFKTSQKLPELGFLNEISNLRSQRTTNPLMDALYRGKMRGATESQRKMEYSMRRASHSQPRSFALFGQPQETRGVNEWLPKFQTLD